MALTRWLYTHTPSVTALQRASWSAAMTFLADLMGHESIETTRIYLRKTSTEQRAIVDEVIDW